MSRTPRITAGYDDDAPRELVFPAVARTAGAAVVEIDPVATAASLKVVLETLGGGAASVADASSETLEPLDWWRAGDGALWAVGGGTIIAAATLALSCGGGFVAEAGTLGSPHVARCRADLHLRLREALHPGLDWLAVPDPGIRPLVFAVEVGGLADRIVVASLAAPIAVTPPDPSWSRALRRVLDGFEVPVRLVLHDGPIAVRAARALGVGDVLPIAAASEVGLRVGTLGFGRGHIEETDGVTRVRIVTRGRGERA